MSCEVLTVGSLFSGIGGIDLGLERAGMRTRWFVEYDPHCQNVLRRHWPGVPVYGDIKAVDWRGVERVDVLAGGFPCQPISAAGKQLAQEDSRWLWPEFARAIRALRPRFVLVENVANLLAVNGGRAFGEVVGDLAALGYDAEWDCIPASAVGALHERDRLWLVAYPKRSGAQSVGVAGDISGATGSAERTPPQRERRGDATGNRRKALADAAKLGRREDGPRPPRQARHAASGGADMADTERWHGEALNGVGVLGTPSGSWSAERSPNGRLPGHWQWSPEPDVGRVADGVPHRVDRLRSLGNAVLPQVVEWIGRRIVAVAEGR